MRYGRRHFNNSLVIRQKDESQNEGNKKTKHAKFSEKVKISYPLIRTRHLYSNPPYYQFSVISYPLIRIRRFRFKIALTASGKNHRLSITKIIEIWENLRTYFQWLQLQKMLPKLDLKLIGIRFLALSKTKLC